MRKEYADLQVKDGKIEVKDKIRGSKKALKKVISDFESVNVDFNSPIIIDEILSQEIFEGLKKYFEDKDIKYIHGNVGCTVGIHSGVKACGIFFVEE